MIVLALRGLLAAGPMGPAQARGKWIHTAIKKLLGAGLVIASLGFFILASNAQAAAPTFQSFSAIAAAASGSAGPTVTLPAHAADDILLLATIIRTNIDTIATPAGWTQIGSPTVRSTVATYQFFWKRAASSSETNPSIARAGSTFGDIYAAVIVYRGAIMLGDPWEVKGTVTTGITMTAAITGITTLTADSLVVVAVPGEDNNNASITTTGTDPAAYTEHYVESTTGADGVVTFSEFARTTAGATGTVSVAWDTAVSVGWGGIVLALKPQPPPTAGALPFSYRKKITIDHGKVGTSGATLTDYPFLFNVTDTNLKTVANGGHVTDPQGDDIIFRALDPTTCNDGQLVCTLDHEIENYNPATGTLVAWVRIPSVNAFSASSDTAIYIYSGTTDITASTQYPAGVWNANYNAVWHLKENPAGTAPQMKDSTTNALHATSTGSMTLSQQVAGQINGSLNFDGTNDGLNIPSYTIGDTTTGYFTLEAWINETATSGYRNIVNNCPASCTYPN